MGFEPAKLQSSCDFAERKRVALGMLWMRLLRESFLFAWWAIWANKLRTFLSLLGVMVGIFMISAVFTVVDSLEDNLKDTFNMLDEDVLFVQKWPWAAGGDYPWWKYVQRREPTQRDMQDLASRMTSARALTYQSGAPMPMEQGNNRIESSRLVGVTHTYPEVISLNIDRGRFFTEAEGRAGRPVAIVGAEIADALWGTVEPIGKSFTIRGRKLEVIGVFRREGTSIISDGMDRVAMVPVAFAGRLMDTDRAGGSIMIKAAEGVSNDALADEVIQHFRSVRRLRPSEEDDFAINQVNMLSSIIDNIFAQFEIGGWFIAIFAILVGCFSIANIMFVSVRERTRIIGVQKAIGAKGTFILTQFLFEAVALCLFGAGFALVAIEVLILVVNALDLGLQLAIRPGRILVAIGVAVASGLVAGLAPAQAAARMAPVDAMRSTG